MLGSITPLGERSRGANWVVTVVFYVLGSAIGGAALGAVLGSLGRPAVSGATEVSTTAPLVLLGAFATAGVLFDTHAFGLSLPTIRRQVRQSWLTTYRGWVYGFGFGVQLGLGVVTVVTSSAIYSAFFAAFLSGSAILGAAIGLIFGLLRAATIFAVARVRTFDGFDSLGPTLERLNPPIRYASLATQATVGLALLVLAV